MRNIFQLGIKIPGRHTLFILSTCILLVACGTSSTEIAATDAGVIKLAPEIIGYVAFEEAVVRASPQRDAEIVYRLNKGEQVTLIGVTPDEKWYQVVYDDIYKGWVFYGLISQELPSDQTPVPTSGGTVFVEVGTPKITETLLALLLTREAQPPVGSSRERATETLSPVNSPSPVTTASPTLAKLDIPTVLVTASPTTTPVLLPVDTPTFRPTAGTGSFLGYKLAFASDQSGVMTAYLMNTRNRHLWLEYPLPEDYDHVWWPSFCKDQIAVEAQNIGGSNPQWIYFIDTDSKSVSRLQPSVNADALGVPRCSPDGDLIAYSIKQGGNWGNMVIDQFPASTSDPVHQESSWGFTSWPMDNDYFYSMTREDNQWVIYRTDDVLSGVGSRTKIVTDGKYPAISPDGEYLVYVCNDTEQLCIRHIPSGDTSVLTDLDYVKVNNQNYPATAMWSKDGAWIYYASADGGDWDIFRIRPDGSGRENITTDWQSNEIMPALEW
jgi:hypothetical protein